MSAKSCILLAGLMVRVKISHTEKMLSSSCACSADRSGTSVSGKGHFVSTRLSNLRFAAMSKLQQKFCILFGSLMESK
jgi:hypothetical protein